MTFLIISETGTDKTVCYKFQFFLSVAYTAFRLSLLFFNGISVQYVNMN